MPSSTAFAAANHPLHARAEGNRRGSGRAAEAFLACLPTPHPAPRHRSPGRCRPARRSRRCKQHLVTATDIAQLASGWSMVVEVSPCTVSSRRGRTRLMASSIRSGVKTSPHGTLDGVNLGTTAAGDFAQQMAEAAKYRHQHLVARANSRYQNRFDSRARCRPPASSNGFRYGTPRDTAP